MNFRWSGHDWSFENNSAWFIDAQRDVLCCLDLQLGECKFVAKIPNEGVDKFMLNTRCIKVNNEIFCMPCYGDRIWIYNITHATFKNIKVENHSQDKLYMESCWKYGNKLYVVSRGLTQVIIVDIDTKEIEYYPIGVEGHDNFLSCCIKVETKIYCTSYNSSRIYQFDMDSKETVVYTIPQIKENLALICFDGNKFWLSGYSKKIYVWDTNKVEVIENFPKQFGNYNFFHNSVQLIDHELEKYDTQLFCKIEAVGNYIWAIPYKTNFVLYIDKNTFEIHVLTIKDEEETKKSLQRRWKFKYFWQYLRDNRYIGIFSLKNNYILEIDTIELKEAPKNYILDNDCLKSIWDQQILYESHSMQKALFDRLVMVNDVNGIVNDKQNKIGNRIYSFFK